MHVQVGNSLVLKRNEHFLECKIIAIGITSRGTYAALCETAKGELIPVPLINSLRHKPQLPLASSKC